MMLITARSRSGDRSWQSGLPLLRLVGLTIVLVRRERLPRRANGASGDGG
jgi:hypothetical protein